MAFQNPNVIQQHLVLVHSVKVNSVNIYWKGKKILCFYTTFASALEFYIRRSIDVVQWCWIAGCPVWSMLTSQVEFVLMREADSKWAQRCVSKRCCSGSWTQESFRPQCQNRDSQIAGLGAMRKWAHLITFCLTGDLSASSSFFLPLQLGLFCYNTAFQWTHWTYRAGKSGVF